MTTRIDPPVEAAAFSAPGTLAPLGPIVDGVGRGASVGELYVVGGQQRSLRSMRAIGQDWYEYQKAMILRLDTTSGQATVPVEYVSPPDTCPDEDPAILFKSGTLVGDRLYVSTQTEVLVYAVPEFRIVHHLSLPSFNDVHHVRPTPTGTLLVAITGLDMVAEVTLEGRVVREWNVLGEDPWGGRFSRDVDYRKVHSTKPHLAHPNHVFFIGDEPWATRFVQQDAISLTDPTRRIEIGVERLHDGVVYGDRVLFTAVNGKVVVADTRSLRVLEVIDLNEMHRTDVLIGWCRGIFLDGDRLWVGFSRIRPTKFRENVAWLGRGLKSHIGTHVACYDLASRRCLAEIELEAFGLNAVFGIFPATG